MSLNIIKSYFSSYRMFWNLFRKNLLCRSADCFHMDICDESKSSMEIVNVPLVVSVYRQALQTFDDSNKKDIATNMSKLKVMMDKLKAEDFNLDKNLQDPAYWKKPKKAPCTYIEIYQSNKITMSIFVLRPGFKMPLHDHPYMNGFLKVLSGAVKIKSFSEYPVVDTIDPKKFLATAKEQIKHLVGQRKNRRLFAEVTKDIVCSANSETCTLTPTVSNYHEIEALQMPAAFFDILSPPYDTFVEGIGPRRCHYYHVVNEISTNLVELEENDQPSCFYCDQAPYLGPHLV